MSSQHQEGFVPNSDEAQEYSYQHAHADPNGRNPIDPPGLESRLDEDFELPPGFDPEEELAEQSSTVEEEDQFGVQALVDEQGRLFEIQRDRNEESLRVMRRMSEDMSHDYYELLELRVALEHNRYNLGGMEL